MSPYGGAAAYVPVHPPSQLCSDSQAIQAVRCKHVWSFNPCVALWTIEQALPAGSECAALVRHTEAAINALRGVVQRLTDAWGEVGTARIVTGQLPSWNMHRLPDLWGPVSSAPVNNVRSFGAMRTPKACFVDSHGVAHERMLTVLFAATEVAESQAVPYVWRKWAKKAAEGLLNDALHLDAWAFLDDAICAASDEWVAVETDYDGAAQSVTVPVAERLRDTGALTSFGRHEYVAFTDAGGNVREGIVQAHTQAADLSNDMHRFALVPPACKRSSNAANVRIKLTAAQARGSVASNTWQKTYAQQAVQDQTKKLLVCMYYPPTDSTPRRYDDAHPSAAGFGLQPSTTSPYYVSVAEQL